MMTHMLIAGFMLPIAALYFITGALYTLGIKGHVEKETIMLHLEQPFQPNLDILSKLTTKALLKRNLPLPGGEATLRKTKKSYKLRWDDLRHSVILTPQPDMYLVKMVVRERSTLAQIMRIHRAEAGSAFKVLAIILVAGLIMILSTGVYMAQSISKFRQPVTVAIACGFATILTLLLSRYFL